MMRVDMVMWTKVKKIDYHKADIVKQEVCSRDEVTVYRNKRCVIFKEKLVGGRARVTTG